jgi:acyl-CoA hydrolase
MTARELSVDEAAALLRPRDSLGVPLGPGIPGDFMHALSARDDWEDLEVFGALLLDLYPLLTKPGVRFLSGFFGPAERILRDSGAAIEFVPADFRRFITVAEQRSPRVVATTATPPDADGWMSLSLHAGATCDALRAAGDDPNRVLVVEANPHYPRTFGIRPQFPHALHVDQVDVIVPGTRPPFVLEDPPPTPAELAIAEHARTFITDGSTLQSGIGAVPSTVMALLAEEPGGDYGVHSEMFTTGLMRLHQAGKVTNAHKGTFTGMSITTFALGTQELHDWLHENDSVRFLPVDVVNAPHTIARNNKVVSINSALAVDLLGQVVADRLNDKQFSGIGGHEDFVAQSAFELEDRSLICLPSTATVKGELVSRITPTLPLGAAVTTPRHQVDSIITEFGVAELRGATVGERALALANVAHPDFREPLLLAAAALR